MALSDDPMRAPYGAPELGALVAQRTVRPARSATELEAQQKADRQIAEQLLWKRYIDQGDLEAREALIMMHLPYAKVVAAGLYGKHAYHEAEFEEYVQLATLGLIEALDRYDPARGAQFRTYAHTRMLGAIRDGLEHISERQEQISLHRKLAAERLSAAQAGKKIKDAPPDLHLVQEMAEVSANLILSFMLDDTGMLQGARDVLPDGCYESIVFKQEQQRVRDLLPQLTPREKSVIRLHYLQGLTYEDIARTLGITRGRIAQLHAQAIERLRKLVDC